VEADQSNLLSGHHTGKGILFPWIILYHTAVIYERSAAGNRTTCFIIIKPCIMQHGRSKETWKDRRKDNWNIRRVLCMRCNISWFAYFIKSMGWFSVNLPETTTSNVATLEAYNPLTTVINAVPSNVVEVLGSNNSILAVVVVAVILGLSMNALGDKAATIKSLLQNLNDIVQVYMDFLINKVSPIAIFCMLARTFATYGTEYIRPTLTFMIATIFISLALVVTIYPIGIFLLTGLNPFKFAKKIFKVGMFAAATQSSAATLPLNRKTCMEELGCSKEISSFVLPMGMTINMNGTTAMHMVAITFIATAAGINITPTQLITAAFLSICVAMGTPAIPVAGTTLIFVIMSGLGLSSDLCMVAYALVLAISYLPGMAVITLNVVGDAATTVIVSYKENELDKDVYNS